jgi:hypothetical protein
LWLFPKPLNKGMCSIFGRFIEDYNRDLTCWEKSKYAAQNQFKIVSLARGKKISHFLLGCVISQCEKPRKDFLF